MPDAASSLWDQEGESGFIDDYDFTVERAIFAPDPNYSAKAGSDVILLQWYGTTDNPDQKEHRLIFTLGNGWEAVNGGKSIVRPDDVKFWKDGQVGGTMKWFNKQTSYFRLLRTVLDDFGLSDTLMSRGTPLEAAVWEGMTFHIERQIPTAFALDKDPKEREWPSRFVGIVGEGAVTPASTESSTDKIAAAKAKAAAAKANSGLRAQVVTLLQGHTDEDAGRDAALALEGVSDDDGLLSALFDSSLWNEAHAS